MNKNTYPTTKPLILLIKYLDPSKNAVDAAILNSSADSVASFCSFEIWCSFPHASDLVSVCF